MSQPGDQERIRELERQIAALPVGSVGKKAVNGKEYCYHRWNEGGKRKEKYVPAAEVEHKATWYGKEVVVIDRFYPSSQLCSSCGHRNPETKDLDIREWTCPVCGKHHDRDINAAINILNEGMRLLMQPTSKAG